MTQAKQYFDKVYGEGHIERIVEMNDIISLYGLMEEYAVHVADQWIKSEYLGEELAGL